MIRGFILTEKSKNVNFLQLKNKQKTLVGGL